MSKSKKTAKWRAENPRNCVSINCERRGWDRTDGEDWNFYWASVQTVISIFKPDSNRRLNDSQILCHFPNHYELTKKDLMTKNIKRYRKELIKQRGGPGASTEDLNFIPTTYNLPADYPLFIEEFKRNPNSCWIMKPPGGAQGRGVFIITKPSQIKKWSNDRAGTAVASYIICRYIDNPLLVGGKKFDLRLYCLVTSFKPLKAYMYTQGFARFASVRYNNDLSDLDNLYMHLTNVSIQKTCDDYNVENGGKWGLDCLRLYVESVYGIPQAEKLFKDIENIIIMSLKAVQPVMNSDKHCFECYGYDVLIDDTLKPWLLEVNASPSLTSTTYRDKILKQNLIRDVMNIVIPPDFPEPHKQPYVCNKTHVGDFYLLIDENQDKPIGGSEKRRIWK